MRGNELHPLEEAKWIGAEEQAVSPILLRRFWAREIKSAILFVTGLGYFEAKINDRMVSEEKWIPVVSDYEQRDLGKFGYPLHDRVTHRIYYCKFDVTDLVKNGENLLSIQLGNGFYRQKERLGEGKVYFGEQLKAIYKIVLETKNGKQCFCSDGSETWVNSEIVYSNLYIGEILDPSSVVSEEKRVQVLPDVKAILTEQMGTTDRVIRSITPRLLGTVDGKQIYDVGENISGVVRIHTSAKKGSRIRLRFSEEIGADLNLDFRSTGSPCICDSGREQIMEDVFISDGTERTFEPKFVWHAFRYFEAEGDFEKAEVLVIHSDVAVTSSFESSFEGLQFLYDAYLRTQLDNMHGSIPSDCPHRERLGYTGDGQLCAQAAMMLLDGKEFYRKWIQDILDCQNEDNGHIQHTAPLMGGGGGPGGWGSAVVLVPYAYYKQYGDVSMLQTCYGAMKRWITYMKDHSTHDLVDREEEGGWCLGDWCTLEKVVIPEPFVNTCYLIKCLQIMAEIAEVTGNISDRTKFESEKKACSLAVVNTYKKDNHYCGGVQGADAYAVWAGLEGPEFIPPIAAFYQNLGHFDTGIFGTDILMEIFMEYGYGDLALKLLESEACGSYLYMKRHGATTLWEDWKGEASHNHPMFGACVRQLFTGFLGIRQEEGTAGYSHIRIEPCIPEKLGFINGTLEIPQGKLMVSWKVEKEKRTFYITIPEGVKAEFCYGEKKQVLSVGDNEIKWQSSY